MKNMTKRDLVVKISNDTGMVQMDVLNIVQKFLDGVTEAVSTGQTVELRNFGVFEIKIRKARVGRNPHRPKNEVKIPPRPVVKFKSGKEMRERVLKIPMEQLQEDKRRRK